MTRDSIIWNVTRALDFVRVLTWRSFANLVLHLYESLRQAQRLRARPIHVDMVATRACNLRCTFCKDYPIDGDRFMSVENFETAARQLLPSAIGLTVCSGGEPYLHDRFLDMLRIAHGYKVRTVVLSNGMLLEENLMRTIVREDLIQQHNFSVDGITAGTVESARRNARLDVILGNIDMLVRLREEEGRTRQKIGIRYTLMRSNIEELPAAVRYWGRAGVDELHCSYVSLCNDLDPRMSLFYHPDLTDRMFAEARDAASNHTGLSLHLPPGIREAAAGAESPSRCNYPWRFVFVDSDGQVMPCYNSIGVMEMGRLFGGPDALPIEDIWNSFRYRRLRETVNKDGPDKQFPYCAVCELRCGWGGEAGHLGDAVWLDYISDPAKRRAIEANRAR